MCCFRVRAVLGLCRDLCVVVPINVFCRDKAREKMRQERLKELGTKSGLKSGKKHKVMCE